MLTLCGFALSNYYNKVKMCLLEKGVPFEEKTVMTGKAAQAYLEQSPMAKVPFLVTEKGALSESQVLMDYIERAYPAHPTLSTDPFEASKQLELMTYMELHLELVVRELYPQAFFGQGEMPQDVRDSVRKRLDRALPAFKRLVKFSPYIGGEHFSQADMSAFVHLPLIGTATKVVYGSDLLTEAGVDWKPYTKMIGERASAQKVNADKKDFIAAQQAAGKPQV
jgi:glutathione S-transferase